MVHKDIPTRSNIESLASVREPGCVSIYLPTGPLPDDSELARIELKNARRTALTQIEGSGVDASVTDAVASAIDSLLEDADFWRYQSSSLAILVNGSLVETYRLPHKLTSTVDVSDRFYIKPLARAVTFPQSAHVLALAQNSVRLVRVTADELGADVDVPGLPQDLTSFTNLDLSSGRDTFGRDSEEPKERMREYSSAIDEAVRPILQERDLPLILAAAEPLASIYRSVSSYSRLTASVITGNPEALSGEALADAARPILDGLYRDELVAVAEELRSLEAQDQASTDLEVVARAATFKAIDTLLVDIDRRIPGYIDEESGAVSLDTEDDASNYGVVDEILRRALLSDARLYAVRADDMPNGSAVAATLRFPV